MGKAAKFDGRVKGCYEFSWNFIKLTCVTRIAVPVSITFKIYDLIKPDFFANTILLVAIAYPKVCLPPLPPFPSLFFPLFFFFSFSPPLSPFFFISPYRKHISTYLRYIAALVAKDIKIKSSIGKTERYRYH